jgi:hypothetical protein
VFIYFISPSHQASLTPPHLNEVHARSHESDQDVRGERSCICMLGVRGHVINKHVRYIIKEMKSVYT